MFISIAPAGGFPAGSATAPTATAAPVYPVGATSQPGGPLGTSLGSASVYNPDANQPAVAAGVPVLVDRTPHGAFAIIGTPGWSSSLTPLQMAQQAGLSYL